MAICNHLAPNGAKSILYQDLEQEFGPDKAHDYWEAIRTEQFLLHKKDWLDDITDDLQEHLDENYEPTAAWVKEQLGITKPEFLKEVITKVDLSQSNISDAQKKWLDKDQYKSDNSNKFIGQGNGATGEYARLSKEVGKPVNSGKYTSKDVIFVSANGNRKGRSSPDFDEISKAIDAKASFLTDAFKRRPEGGNAYNIGEQQVADFLRKNGYKERDENNGLVARWTPIDKEEQSTEVKVPKEAPSVQDHEFMNRNEGLVNQQAAKDLIAKRDPEGNIIGYFSSAEQKDIVDSAMNLTHKLLLQDGLLGSNALVKTFKMFQAKALQSPDSNFSYIFDQRVHIANQVLDQMRNLGYTIDSRSREKLLRAIDGVDYQKEIDNTKFENGKMEVDLNEVQENAPELMEALGHGLSDWGEVSFEHAPQDTASGRLKMFIANLTDMDSGIYKLSSEGVNLPKPSSNNLEAYYQKNPQELQKIAEQVNRKGFWMEDENTSNKLKVLLDKNHAILPKRNFLGMGKLVDFEPIFHSILETLADSPTHDFQTYMTMLRATGRPNLINLANELEKGDNEQSRNEFSRLASTQYTQMMMLLFNRVSDGTKYSYKLQPLISNRYSQHNTIIKNWQENQKLSEIMKINQAGQRVIDVDRAKDRWIPNLSVLQKIDWSKEGDKGKQAQAKKFMKDVFNISGIHLNDTMMDNLFKRMEFYTRGTNFQGGVGQQFAITKDGKPAGMFSAFIMKMAGMATGLDIDSRVDTKSDLESRAELNNPLYTENAAMKILAKAAASDTPVLHSGSSKNADGKDIWDYTMHSKLSHAMVDLKDNFDAFASRYEGSDIAKDNHLLKILTNQPALRDKIQLIYMDGMKPTWGNKDRGTMRGKMSDREQYLMSMGLFQNQGNRFETGSHLMSLTHSDKTTTPLFMNMPVLKMNNPDGSTPRDIIGKPGSAFYNVFKGEYDRIIKQKDISFNDSRYDKGKSLFYFMPEFNHESIKKMVDDGFLTDKEFKTLYPNGEKELTKLINNDVELPVINKILGKIATDRVKETFNAWQEQGLIDENSNSFDQEYVRKLLKTYGIDSQDSDPNPISGRKTTTFFKDGKRLTDKEVNNVAIHGATKDYALNYFLHDISLSQLFYGDPALTFKEGHNDMESVDLTMKEYGKRLAKDIAPGLDPYFRPEDKQYNSITLADHIQSEKYLDNLRNIFPSYQKVNATDAQEFTTVKEFLVTKYANGEIPTKVFNEMMKIIKPNEYYEFTDPDHLQYVMQPQKPVFDAARPETNGAILEDYIKTSRIPLYPPATTGLEIDGLRGVMEKRDIASAVFESGKKMGSPIKPAQFFTPDGTFKAPSEDEITNATQKLDRLGFRIQQEVPYDEDKENIKTVSQMNKLIVEGIDNLDGFKIGDKSYSGKEIRAMKEQIRKDMLSNQYDQFLNDWGINKEGFIQDKSKIYDKLSELATKKNFTMNELQGLLGRDKDGNLWIPLQYNTGADKYESMLMSMIKDISQIQMPGKSFVQASSVGLKFKEGVPTNGNIVWAEGYNGESLKTTRVDKITGKVLPAQVMVPFNFQDSDGRIRDIKDFTKIVDGKKYIDSSKIPDELRQLIGARIPNQGHSSMAAMEVVGFLPKEMGDTIFVPAGFTKQMGADFDVDKLYTYRRPYKKQEQIVSDSTKPDHKEITVNDNFQTLKQGEWEGKQENDEAKKQVNQDILSGNVKIGNTGETFHEFEDRVIPDFRNILNTAPANTVIVTHSSVLKLMKQWDVEGRKDSNQVNADAYNNQSTQNGDVVSFKGKNGTIYVVRHGQTEDNEKDNFRSGDTALTKKGILQARESGQQLKDKLNGEVPSSVITSHLPRTIHTSNLLLDEIKGTTDLHSDNFEADRSSLKNDYFDVHQSILTHPEMAEKILKPLDQDDLKNENKLLTPPKVSGSNYYDHINQLKDFQNGKDAKMLVALTSLATTFIPLIQDKDIHYAKDEWTTGANGLPVKNQVRDYIQVKDEHTGKILKLTNLSGNGKSNYTKEDGGELSDTSIRSKSDNQRTIQNAAVDNAKDRALDNLNLSPITYPAIRALMDLETEQGEAVNLKYGTRLLTQPIIKEFNAEARKINDSLSESYDPDWKRTIFNNLKKKYDSGNEDKQEIVFDPQLLKKAQEMDPNSNEFKDHQVAALQLFMKLDELGSRESQVQSLFNQDTQGAGANLLTALDKSNKMENLNMSPLANGDSIGFWKGKITEAGKTAQVTTDAANQFLTQLLPYDKYLSVFNELKTHSGKPNMSIDDQRAVLRSVRSFIYNSGQHWWADAGKERDRLFYTKGDNLSLARRVEDAKRTWGKDNYFLQRLDPTIGNTQSAPDYLSYQASSVGTVDEQNNNRAWLEMLMSKNSDQRKLGEDLLRYAYLTGGVQDANSFVKFVPNAYISNTDFGNMLKEKGESYMQKSNEDNTPSLDMPGFIPQYIQHNPKKAFVIKRESFGDQPDGQNYPESFRVDPVKNPEFYGDNGAREFVSYKSPTENKWILYHYNPQAADWYTRIDTLGNEFTDEYDGENPSIARSGFKENQALAAQLPPMDGHAQYAKQLKDTLGDFYKGVTPHEQLNIHEGSEFNLPLKTIAHDEEVPQYLRSVADLYSRTDVSDMEHEAKKLLGQDYNAKISFDKDMTQQGTAHSDGRIILNPKTDNKTTAAETFIHEMTHQRVLSSIMLAGYDNRFDSLTGESKDRFEQIKAQFAKDHPEAIQHIRELDRIRLEAFNRLKSEMGEDRIREAERKINAKEALNQEESLLYGSQSLQEFIPHIMSDKYTQDYLSKIPSSSGTFLGRIWGKIIDLIRSITGSKESSLLDEALYHSIALTAPEEHGDFTQSMVRGEDMRVSTEQHANDLKNLGENVYNRDTNIKSDLLGHDVSFGKLKKEPAQSGIPFITKKLKEQMDKAYADVSKGTLEERTQARIRYNELKFDYHDVVREHNAPIIAQVAKHQLDYIDSVLRNPANNAATTIAALDAANMWSSLIDNMYGDSTTTFVDDSLRGLQEQATAQRKALINKKAKVITMNALSNRVTLVPTDFKEDLTNPDYFSGNTLALARVKSKFLSAIGAHERQAANNRDEEITRVNAQLRGLAKDFKRLGITPSMFMQKDSWGLRDRLSNKWHEFLADESMARDSKLNSAYRAEGLTNEQRNTLKRDADQTYYNNLNKVAAIVDTRAFFDFKTGDHKNDAGYKDAMDKLSAKVGSEEYAKELVNQAHEKYQDYIKERQYMVDHIQSETQLTDEEKKGLDLNQQEEARNKKMEEQLTKWLATDSPDKFLDRLHGTGDLKYLNNGDRFLVMAPKHDQVSFYDNTYNEIDANGEIRKVFDEYKALIQKHTSYLPPEHSEKLPPGFLPIVSPETVNSLAGIFGKLRDWDNTVMNQFMGTEKEEAARLHPDEIPIMYTRELKKDQEKSDDLINVAKAFAMMAIHYKHMAPVLDEINVMESIVKNAQRQRAEGTDEGPSLTRALDILKYNKDRLIFQKPNELEAKIPGKYYTLKPLQAVRIQKEVKALTEEKTDLEKQIREKEDKGELDVDKEQDRIDVINKKLEEHEKNAKYIYGSKIGDTLISLNQLKAVAYNPFSVVPVACFNNISMMNFATGRMEYDPSHLWQARGITTHAMKSFYTMGKAGDTTSRKIQALMERSGVMTSLTNLNKQVDFNRSHAKEAFSPFNWHQAADYYNKSTMMVAMMLKKTVEVEDKDTGEKSQVRLWDALDGEGKWDTSKYKSNDNWYSNEVSSQKEWNSFRDKMRGVANIVFGNQDKNAPLLAKKSVIGRMIGQFRISWFPEGIETRWGSPRYDPLLQREVKGRYRSFGTLGIASSFFVMARSVLDMLPGITVDRFKGLTDKNGEQITDLDKENMRRNFAGMAWTVGITASILLLKATIAGQQGKKRDEKDSVLQMITNSLIRNQQDLIMYASPSVYDTVVGNLVPASTVITDAMKAMKATGHYFFGDNKKDKHAWETWMLHLTKATPILNNINKAKYMATRNLDDIQR